jgi:hypothetical protein
VLVVPVKVLYVLWIPAGAITAASPYIQNCSSINGGSSGYGSTGVQIDGLTYIVQVINLFYVMTLHKLTQTVSVFTQSVAAVVRWFLSLLTIVLNLFMLHQAVLLEVLTVHLLTVKLVLKLMVH